MQEFDGPLLDAGLADSLLATALAELASRIAAWPRRAEAPGRHGTARRLSSGTPV